MQPRLPILPPVLRPFVAASLLALLAAAAPGGAAAGPTAFRDCQDRTAAGDAVCPEMMPIPPGRFVMGSPAEEEGHRPDEEPLHPVGLDRAFAMGRTEVTFAQWDACVAGGGCGGHRAKDYGWGRRSRPVIGVSWADAQAYAQWLSGKTGHRYRLPSEAEWEYAARGGTSTPFHTGPTINSRQANLLDDNLNGLFTYRQTTVPAGSFPPNPFGLHDVHGNVWEWVEDCHAPSYIGAPADGTAQTAQGCGHRVLRGGGWYQVKTGSRAANRNWADSSYRSNEIGFRVARALD